MMGLGAADTERMDLHEYEQRLWHWNEAHDTSGNVGAPDPHETQALLDRINANPALTGPAPPKGA